MTEDQTIRAAALIVNRRAVRSVFRDPKPLTLNVTTSDGKSTSIPLDIHSTRAALNAIDGELSDRLGKLGVPEV